MSEEFRAFEQAAGDMTEQPAGHLINAGRDTELALAATAAYGGRFPVVEPSSPQPSLAAQVQPSRRSLVLCATPRRRQPLETAAGALDRLQWLVAVETVTCGG